MEREEQREQQDPSQTVEWGQPIRVGRVAPYASPFVRLPLPLPRHSFRRRPPPFPIATAAPCHRCRPPLTTARDRCAARSRARAAGCPRGGEGATTQEKSGHKGKSRPQRERTTRQGKTDHPATPPPSSRGTVHQPRDQSGKERPARERQATPPRHRQVAKAPSTSQGKARPTRESATNQGKQAHAAPPSPCTGGARWPSGLVAPCAQARPPEVLPACAASWPP